MSSNKSIQPSVSRMVLKPVYTRRTNDDAWPLRGTDGRTFAERKKLIQEKG